ncbi:MAG: type II secretion system F family protein [Acidobacteria bacterium]|nr:type II secretion system F family protein [Acidobacteriota bacterium]
MSDYMVAAVIGLAWGAVGWLVYDALELRFILYLDKYGAQVQESLDAMFVPVSEKVARRILVASILGLAAVGYIVSWNFLVLFYAAAIGMFLPVILLRVAKRRRIEKFDAQMMDIVNVIGNCLKSGLGLQQAFEFLVQEMKPPASEEFDLALKEIRMGAQIEDALGNLGKRVPLPELDMMIISIQTLRRTGGNMVETFEVVGNVIKERRKVEGKIKALTAEGLTQGYIMCAMPAVLGSIIYLLDPEFISPLFETFIGWIMMSVMVGMIALGWVVIKKMVSIEV